MFEKLLPQMHLRKIAKRFAHFGMSCVICHQFLQNPEIFGSIKEKMLLQRCHRCSCSKAWVKLQPISTILPFKPERMPIHLLSRQKQLSFSSRHIFWRTQKKTCVNTKKIGEHMWTQNFLHQHMIHTKNFWWTHQLNVWSQGSPGLASASATLFRFMRGKLGFRCVLGWFYSKNKLKEYPKTRILAEEIFPLLCAGHEKKALGKNSTTRGGLIRFLLANFGLATVATVEPWSRHTIQIFSKKIFRLAKFWNQKSDRMFS